MTLLTPYWGLDVVIILASLVAAVYMYLAHKFKYWSNRGVMELAPTSYVGNYIDSIRGKLNPADLIQDLYDKSNGVPYIGFYLMGTPYLLARDPEMVKNILVRDYNYFADRNATAYKHDGVGGANIFLIKNPAWKVLRSRLTPIFTTGKLRRIYELMAQAAVDFEKRLDKLYVENNGKEIDFNDLCVCFTTDCIGSSAFGLQANASNDPQSPFREFGKRIFDEDSSRALQLRSIFFFPLISRLLRATMLGKKAKKFFTGVFWEVVRQRTESGEKKGDLIDLLIELREKYKDENRADGLVFDGDQLLAQVMLFYIAGIETSANTTSCTLYELALHPDIQAEVRKEIVEGIEKNGGKVTYELVMNLPYLDMVVSETLRKYPSLAFLDRIATADYKVPNYDLVIKKGTPVYIPARSMHYDPEFFPDPEKYDPLRFTDEAKKSRPHFAYLPFGEGPHMCSGMRLGIMQAKYGIVLALKNYEISTCEKTNIPMSLTNKGLILTILGGIYLNVRKVTNE